MTRFRFFSAAAALGVTAWASLASAQDASLDATTVDASGVGDSSTPMGDAAIHVGPVCPDAPTTETGAVMFTRSGPVDFGPGTGAGSVGDHSTIGLDYNLLFSGTYTTGMAGTLHVDWPRALTVSATPTPGSGYLDVMFGLRMMATLWVAGIAIPIPLDMIIADHDGSGASTFDPWAWNYENTDVHLNVSAWRDLYTTDPITVASSSVTVALQMRYNVDASIRTVEIGFPDPTAPATMQTNLGVITEMMPTTVIPPPRNGSLDLLTRWKSSLRYQGSFEFRLNPTCAEPVYIDPVCAAATGLLSSILTPISTPPLITSTDTLPDPYDQMPHFDFPIEQIDQTEIDFGDVHIGESVQLPMVVANPGRATLAADPLPPDDPRFTVGNGACITAGSNAMIPVTFHPTSVGTFQATMRVQSNGITGAPTDVTLTGNGVTGATRPPNSRTDAGRANDAAEYHGAEIEASCACRAAGVPTGRQGRSGLALMFGLAGIVAARRRRGQR